MFNLNSKKVIRLQTMNEALRQQNIGLQSKKNKLETQRAEVVKMIEGFDFLKDNVYTLLRQIQTKLNS